MGQSPLHPSCNSTTVASGNIRDTARFCTACRATRHSFCAALRLSQLQVTQPSDIGDRSQVTPAR